MNISEMHVWFRQYAQQMGMQNVRAILPEQIDLLINTSINDVVNKIIAENISSRNDRVISDNSKIGQINALRTLYDVIKLTSSDVESFAESLDKHKKKPYEISLDKIKDYLYLIDFSISYQIGNSDETDIFPVRLIDRAYLADTLQDYILSPRFRTPIAVVFNTYKSTSSQGVQSGDSNVKEELEGILEIYTGKNELHETLIKTMCIKELQCSVIRKPAKVKYVKDVSGINVDCDLPDVLHYDILKHAVDLYRLSIAGSIAASQEQAQNQARENLRNNIREE